MLGARGVSGDKGEVYIGGHDAGKLYLGFFRGFLQSLKRHFILAQVYAVFLLEFIRQIIHDLVIKIVAAQAVVSAGGQNLKHAVADFKD